MLKKSFLIFILSCFTLIAQNQSHSLDFYLKEGLQNSPLLNEYRNQINSATSDSLLIKASKKPFVEARSQLMYAPFSHNFGYDDVITDGGNYTAVMGVSQNIFNKKQLTNQYNATNLQKQLAANSTRITSNEINKAITDQYLIAFSAYNDYLFNTSFLELFEKENKIVTEFVKNGVCKQTDYLSLVVETQSQVILVSQLKGQFRKELMQLNVLCGLHDSAWVELTEPQIGIKGKADIAKSPSYIQYKIDSVKIENEKAAIDIRYRLKVNWFADAGFLTSTPFNFYNHFGASAGIGMNIPIYDGKQKDIEKHKLEFDENTRQVYQASYHNQYFQQIQQLKDELRSLSETFVQMENQLKISDQLVNALKEQLEAGNIQMTEYINAIKNLKNISRNLNLMKMQKLQVINEMNFLLTQ